MFSLKYIVDKMFLDKSDTHKILNFLDKFVKVHLEPFVAEKFEELCQYMNAYKNCLVMNREVIADRGIWRGKKNYILQVWDQEGYRYDTPKLKMMGVETVKSSTPGIVRGSLEQAINIILNKDEAQLQKFISAFKKKFWSAPISSIAFPRGVNDLDKWVDDSGNIKSGCPIHVRGSISYNNLIRKHKLTNTLPFINSANKIKFIYLKKENPSRQHVIAFLDELPHEFGLDDFIDKDTQFEKTFLGPCKSFTSIIGWNTEETFTLDDFFK
jgi:hypothetical protein